MRNERWKPQAMRMIPLSVLRVNVFAQRKYVIKIMTSCLELAELRKQFNQRLPLGLPLLRNN
jgi:hypothetical protein